MGGPAKMYRYKSRMGDIVTLPPNQFPVFVSKNRTYDIRRWIISMHQSLKVGARKSSRCGCDRCINPNHWTFEAAPPSRDKHVAPDLDDEVWDINSVGELVEYHLTRNNGNLSLLDPDFAGVPESLIRTYMEHRS